MRSTQVIVDAMEKREGWGPSEDDTGLNGELCWASSMVSSTNGELCWAVSTVSKGSFQLPSHSTTHNTPARLIFDLADEPRPTHNNDSFCWKRGRLGTWMRSYIWWLSHWVVALFGLSKHLRIGLLRKYINVANPIGAKNLEESK